ncbi:MAG: rRNA maturation RNase YbeY [Pseudomonadota bacterium]
MTARLNLDVQYAGSEGHPVPSEDEFHGWVNAALPEQGFFSLLVRVVTQEESQSLNDQFRGKQRPTNVLSFPIHVQDETGAQYLGDVVICEKVVSDEAQAQEKDPVAHWAHLTVHGVLHLLGFDHEIPEEAVKMENREVEILAGLGYQDPYH